MDTEREIGFIAYWLKSLNLPHHTLPLYSGYVVIMVSTWTLTRKLKIIFHLIAVKYQLSVIVLLLPECIHHTYRIWT